MLMMTTMMMMMMMGWTGSLGETHGTEQRYTDERVRHTAVVLGTARSGYTLFYMVGGWTPTDEDSCGYDERFVYGLLREGCMTGRLYVAGGLSLRWHGS